MSDCDSVVDLVVDLVVSDIGGSGGGGGECGGVDGAKGMGGRMKLINFTHASLVECEEYFQSEEGKLKPQS